MPNDQAHDTRTTTPANRLAQAVGLNVAARAALSPVSGGGEWPAEFDGTIVVSSRFESANKTPEVNDVGFTWSDTSIASVVTMDPDPLIVYDMNGPANTRPDDLTTDWTAKSGDYSLRLRANAGSVWPEQSFYMTGPSLKTVWLAWDMRVPVNFDHQPRPDGGVGNNNKLFRLYTSPNKSTDNGSMIGMEFRRSSLNEGPAPGTYWTGPGSSYWYVKLGSEFQSSGDKLATDGSDPRGRFITIPNDLGRWMRVVIKAKTSSSYGALDGSIEIWRKWEDETDFTKEFDFQNQGLPCDEITGNGFLSGYLFGYQNMPYAVDTDFLFDNFKIARGIE